MRRADRLFQIIQLLRRRRRPITAGELAERLRVSERTVYRDVRDLIDSGVPLRGEAGVGYVLSRSYDLPPLMFDEQELEALVLGARIVQSWADPGLAAAADALMAKVEVVVPERLRPRIDATTLYSINLRPDAAARARLGDLRAAVAAGRRVRFAYTDAEGVDSRRTVRPLGLFFWGVSWTLASWCELREDFRNFRIDRIDRLEVLDDAFEAEPGKTLEDLFRRYEEGEGAPRSTS
ncbi:MAG: YafY family protein [Thermoanaerobaculia bacterium]|nr:YafY family protein [Thermoanaerobaculia bacterium]